MGEQVGLGGGREPEKMTMIVYLERCLCSAEVKKEGEVRSCGGKRAYKQLQK